MTRFGVHPREGIWGERKTDRELMQKAKKKMRRTPGGREMRLTGRCEWGMG